MTARSAELAIAQKEAGNSYYHREPSRPRATGLAYLQLAAQAPRADLDHDGDAEAR